jgi:hypothetical protein
MLDEFDNKQESDFVHFQKITSTSKILTEELVSLLEERLIVNFTRRKVGEIVVRKEIETHILQVQVPVRREKLIVEQVSPEYKRIAEVDIGQADISSVGRETPLSVGFYQSAQPTVYGEIQSPKAASDLLNEIASMPSHDCETVRVEIVLKNSKNQETYQALFKRYG